MAARRSAARHDDLRFIPGGSVRRTARSRYRQRLTHKLATWVAQFGTSGCVGCGRCITWCPAGAGAPLDATTCGSAREHPRVRRNRPRFTAAGLLTAIDDGSPHEPPPASGAKTTAVEHMRTPSVEHTKTVVQAAAQPGAFGARAGFGS